MGAAASGTRESARNRRAPSKPRVAARPTAAAAAAPRPTFAELHRTLGNLGVQRLLNSGLLRGQEAAARAALRSSEPPAPGAAEATVPIHPAPDAGASTPPPAGPEAAPPRPAGEPPGVPAGQPPAEGVEAPGETLPPAPIARPEQDPGFQGVVRKLATNATRQKTPVVDAAGKVTQLAAAAELPPARQKEKAAYDDQLKDMGEVPIPVIKDVTVTEFMAAFEQGFTELAKQIPKASEDNHAISNAVDFGREKTIAVGELNAKTEEKTEALRTAASRNPLETAASAPAPAQPPDLVRDPAGPIPAIANARAAAAKPVPSERISLDSHSKALDDALAGQVAGGQVLNISEDSLAFPVSGEKSFDEAGEAKRKAQEAIRKLIPSYRTIEDGALKKAGSAAAHVVKTGLQDYHGARDQSFGAVLDVQKGREQTVETEKDTVLRQFADTFGKKKELVEGELRSLNEIGEEFAQLLTKAESELKGWVRQNLEYIYTPGMFDYSDWIDERRDEVEAEYERLSRGQPNDFSLGNQQGLLLWLKALKTIQDKDATELFGQAKASFLRNVTDTARTIAQKVVDALSRANGHIRAGLNEAQVIYDGLSATEKREYHGAFIGVVGQYTTLAESVADRHREIVGDLARSYHKVASTLDATFEAIRKDVLTSWWEKAWNKIKAVVSAIIEFATRIGELLVGMLHLLGDIISSPRYFFSNLVTGIGRGLSTFVERIDEFLAEAFFDWLRGASGVSVQLPSVWDAKGIFGLFTQLLGLSVETIWQRMEVVYDKTIANAFRRGEVLLDKGLELFAIVRAEGLGGLWDHIQESLGTILSDTLSSLKETVLYAAIKKVMIEVGKLLVPGGGFIAIAEKIIRLLQFIVEARNKILDLIESFMQSMELAVRGDVSGIVTKITGALKLFITVALDFLVTFFGLGGLKSKIERVIERTRSPVIRGIDWALGKLKPAVMRVAGAAGRVKAKAVALLEWWRERRAFRGADGKEHSLFVQGGERRARLMVASEEREITVYLSEVLSSSTATKTMKDFATRASQLHQQKLAPVIAGSGDEQLLAEFTANLTRLSGFLQKIVGAGYADLPATAAWTPKAPKFAAVEKLSTRTSAGGTEPTEDPKGWSELQKAGLTRLHGDWKRMHMITAGVGGKGEMNNLVPAPTSVNSGSVVRDFETSVEDLVKRQNARTKRPNVIWVRVTSAGYHPAFADPVRDIAHDGTTFVNAVTFEAGLHFPEESDEWTKDPTPVLKKSTPVPVPNFTGQPVDLNSVGRVYIEKVTGVKPHFASEIAERREQNLPGKWKGINQFVADMNRKRKEEGREVTEEFKEAIQTVIRSFNKGQFRFEV